MGRCATVIGGLGLLLGVLVLAPALRLGRETDQTEESPAELRGDSIEKQEMKRSRVKG